MMDLQAKLEALLFVADSPIPLDVLVRFTGAEKHAIQDALEALARECQERRGVQLIRIAGGYQLCSKPEFAELIAAFLKPQKMRLSRAQMEVLAIVAYQQPVTSAEIDAVRGVQSDHGLKALMERRLVREVGRKQTPGRPLLYGTTDQFLHHFGIEGLGALPALTLELPASPDHGGSA